MDASDGLPSRLGGADCRRRKALIQAEAGAIPLRRCQGRVGVEVAKYPNRNFTLERDVLVPILVSTGADPSHTKEKFLMTERQTGLLMDGLKPDAWVKVSSHGPQKRFTNRVLGLGIARLSVKVSNFTKRILTTALVLSPTGIWKWFCRKRKKMLAVFRFLKFNLIYYFEIILFI